MKLLVVTVFLLLTVISVVVSWWLNRRRQIRHAATLDRSVAEGLGEPPSLHPIIDPNRCIGTAACIRACPEGGILGIVDGRAALIAPSRCIGHGACLAACPTHAVELVFGTARRGVEIPHVKSDFETNVPGIYIAGELGGMGLVRNAMSQGFQAVESVARSLASCGPHDLEHDVAIIGAGPAGLAASLAAKRAGLRYVTLEQEALGGTVYHYPRDKMVLTRPIDLPGYGRIGASEIRKEELLRLWNDIIRTAGIDIRVRERVTAVEPLAGGFAIDTQCRRYRAARVVLAIGRRGSPRKLGIVGEEAPHVAYCLRDPTEVRRKSILIVGGGNSALEAAIRLAAPILENTVILCHRGAAFGRATPANRARIQDLSDAGQVKIYTRSDVVSIGPRQVEIRVKGVVTRIPAEQVYIMIGGELPTSLLHRLGVKVDVKFGKAEGLPPGSSGAV
jgi:thioredoxin reductase/NAD-dependent dihydropyrimidine dehydrogenase PreA subunit